MRKAIFVAVVAAHLALVWYFLTLWRLPVPLDEDQPSMTMVFLPPPELTAIADESIRERTAQHTPEMTGQRRAYVSRPPSSDRTLADQTPSRYAASPKPPVESPAPAASDQPTPLLPSVPQQAPPNGAPTFIVSMPDWHQQAEMVAQSEAPGHHRGRGQSQASSRSPDGHDQTHAGLTGTRSCISLGS